MIFTLSPYLRPASTTLTQVPARTDSLFKGSLRQTSDRGELANVSDPSVLFRYYHAVPIDLSSSPGIGNTAGIALEFNVETPSDPLQRQKINYGGI